MIHLKRISLFMANIYRQRETILILAKRDLEERYIGTLGGVLWTIVHPLAMVLIFWFVFAVGFKAKGPANSPFTLYFVCAYVPWLTFSEILRASNDALIRNSHLVKHLVFPTEILPVVYLISASVTHVFLLVIVLGLNIFYGYGFPLSLFQLLYYFLAMCLLCLGLGWFLAAMQVLYRDVGQALTVVLNLWFWLTPIVWTMEIVPGSLRWVFKLNPMFYIVNGYRDSFFLNQALWNSPKTTLYYWVVAVFCFVIGASVFRRLKADFADML